MVIYLQAGATPEDLIAFFRDHSAPLVGKMTKANAANRYGRYDKYGSRSITNCSSV